MIAPALVPDVDLLDLLAELDLIGCACGCGAVFDVAAYRARAAETGMRAFPPITTERAA